MTLGACLFFVDRLREHSDRSESSAKPGIKRQFFYVFRYFRLFVERKNNEKLKNHLPATSNCLGCYLVLCMQDLQSKKKRGFAYVRRNRASDFQFV